MVQVQDDRGLYVAQFERIERADGAFDWFLPVRKKAITRFTELGFPTTKEEEWRFTNVAPIAERSFDRADDAGASLTRDEIASHLNIVGDTIASLVLVNGRVRGDLSHVASLPKGVLVRALADAAGKIPESVKPHLGMHASFEGESFVALNTALMEDGAFVHVGAGTVVPQPIHVLNILSPGATPTVAHPRNLFVVEESAQVAIIEQFVTIGDGEGFTNAVTEIVAGNNAHVDHYSMQLESTKTFHIGTRQIYQTRDAYVASHGVTLGGAMVRNNINAVLDGEGGDCQLKGLYLVENTQHVDNHLTVDHAKPHCDSREFFKGVLEDEGRGVFSGRIIVREDAQKTDAKQTNQSLLLSGKAQIESKPQLEIFADDVKCTHGATIGQVDAEALFYLRARGIPADAAHSMLVLAFARENIDEIKIEPLRRALDDKLVARMPHGRLLREEA